MIKKISAIILALVLCLSVMVVPVSAAHVNLGDAKMAVALKWDKESYSAGETAVLSVYMDAADDLSLFTGSILVGLSSKVFEPVATADLRNAGTTAEWFNAYYQDHSTAFSQLAATVVSKVQALNTAEENAAYDWYIKFGLAKNGSGWHENTATTKAGFGGDEFNPDEPIFTVSLTVKEGVADGTVAAAAVTSGSLTCTPVQTSVKYYKTPGTATTTGNIAATDIDYSQAVATATVGEAAPSCTTDHATVADDGDCTTPVVCPECKEVIKEAATAHSYVDVEGKDATCTEDGYEAYQKCTVCDVTTEIVVLPAAHKYEDVEAKAPTCTEDGYTAHQVCTVCGEKVGYTVVPADGTTHNYVDVEGKDATCTEDGYTAYQECTRCGEKVGYTVIPAAHKYEDVEAKDATCTEDGYTAHQVCTVCGEKVGYTVVPAAHKYEDVEAKDATCTEDGYTAHQVCTVCGEKVGYTVIPTNGHEEETITIEATTYADGKVIVKCTECGEIISETVIPAEKVLVATWKNQIRFHKNADGTYAGSFDMRTIAVIKGEDFTAAFGPEDEALTKIKRIGFVYSKMSMVSEADFDMAKVRDTVENGAKYEGYTNANVSTISKTISPGNYAFACTVTGIEDANRTDGLIAVGYVAWDSDANGSIDSYAYYPAEKVVSFQAAFDALFDTTFPNG